jgi:hypothetical protein
VIPCVGSWIDDPMHWRDLLDAVIWKATRYPNNDPKNLTIWCEVSG